MTRAQDSGKHHPLFPSPAERIDFKNEPESARLLGCLLMTVRLEFGLTCLGTAILGFSSRYDTNAPFEFRYCAPSKLLEKFQSVACAFGLPISPFEWISFLF
jgi:hypothetical protein